MGSTNAQPLGAIGLGPGVLNAYVALTNDSANGIQLLAHEQHLRMATKHPQTHTGIPQNSHHAKSGHMNNTTSIL